MATTTLQRVRLSGGPLFGGWKAKIPRRREIVADTIADLSAQVRDVVGDRPWVWSYDFGEDTDWYIQMVHIYHQRHGEGFLSNEKYLAKFAEALWALGLYHASQEDAAALLGVPLDWVRRVWPPPEAYDN